MAGGGSGAAKITAATKKRLNALREVCPEAKNKSNQELVQLLENYNDQTDMVVEALRTGDAEDVIGGWATTSKKGKAGKKKKVSESDTKDNLSEASSSRPPAVIQDKDGVMGKSKSSVTAKLNGENPSVASKASVQAHPKRDNVPKKEIQEIAPPKQAIVPKEVPIPDIHVHASSFSRLLTQLTEMHMDDIKNLDFAFEQIRRLVEHRYETLRRNMERSEDQASQILYHRHNQSGELVDRVTQATALSPKEYADWQQDCGSFTKDYKNDVHLATVPRFSYSLESLQREVNKFGDVEIFMPTYTYKPATSVPRHVATESHKTAPPSQSAPKHVTSAPATSRTEAVNQRPTPPVATHTQVRPESQSYSAIPEKRPEAQRVTIMPKDGGSFAPMESLVISGGNLTAEELASLTQSLQNSLQLGAADHTRNGGAKVNGGFESTDYSEQDIFSGGAVWTNSNAGHFGGGDNWNTAAPDFQPPAGFVGDGSSFGHGPSNGFAGNGYRQAGPPNRGGPGYRGPRRGGRGPIGRGGRPPHRGSGNRGAGSNRGQ
ncbi:uncharacterized protein LOC129600897 isoform X2 [Paramacrobiotus metropolitanus]|nr:uncharacterized protein LOC129600897 isoform X2 [Paramacrobiotus metropolitanus]